jgi:hypothetical protein
MGVKLNVFNTKNGLKLVYMKRFSKKRMKNLIQVNKFEKIMGSIHRQYLYADLPLQL